ncbi:F-box protein At1g30790-like [Bidens hawaiensis]|uniref:F-box protein At1g30790-like n=1 Tax=Bidens hawaiensis TaxID=980011 RepID=UPI00404946CE
MFSANDDGGSLTHLMTLHPKRSDLMQIETEHLNGLVLLTLKYTHLNYYEAVVVNPSTRKMLKLDYGASGTLEHAKFFFGFDESANEHKILRARGDVESTTTFEIMGLSRSNYSWRKIDATFDIGQYIWFPDIRFDHSVCVNSVIHFMLRSTSEILAFDLRTETISIIKAPPYDKTERNFWTSPYLMRINGCNIGVVRSPRLVVTNIMHIWILKDYEHHVWAKETIIFIYPNFLKESGLTFQLDYGSTGEIIFAPTNFGSVITAPIYNMKSRRFKTVSFTLDHPLPGLKDLKGLRVYQIKRYLESILPLLAT